MKQPPKKLDGADVVKWAWSGNEPFFTMEDAENVVEIYGLAICKYDDSDTFYRFVCNESWEVENDSSWNSITEACKAKSLQYDIDEISWNDVTNN